MADSFGKFKNIFKRLESLEVEAFNNNAPRVNETIDHVNDVDDRLNETIGHINDVDDRLNETIGHINHVDDRLDQTIGHINRVDDRDKLQLENNSQVLSNLSQHLNQVELTLKDHHQFFVKVDTHIVSLTSQLLNLTTENNEIKQENNLLKQITIKNKDEINNLKILLDSNKKEIKLIKENDLKNEQLLKNKSSEIAKLAERDAMTLKCGMARLDYNVTELKAEITRLDKDLKVQSQQHLEVENKFYLKLKENYDEIMASQLVTNQNNHVQVQQELIKIQDQLDINISYLKDKLLGLEQNFIITKDEINVLKLDLSNKITVSESQENYKKLTIQIDQVSKNLSSDFNEKIYTLKEQMIKQSGSILANSVNQVKIRNDIEQLSNYNSKLKPYLHDWELKQKKTSENIEINEENLEILRQVCTQVRRTLQEHKKEIITMTNKLAAAENQSCERQQKIELQLAEVDSKLGPFNLRNLIKVEIENFVESERRPKGRKMSEFFNSQIPYKQFKYNKKHKSHKAGDINFFTMEPWLDILNFKNIFKEQIMNLELLGLTNRVKYKENLIKKAKFRRNKKLIKKHVISLNMATSEIKPTLQKKKLLINKEIKNNNRNQYVSEIAYVDQHKKFQN